MPVSKEDGEEFLKYIEKKVPGMLKSFSPPPHEVLKKLPESSHKYTVKELIDFLEKAYAQGKVKW